MRILVYTPGAAPCPSLGGSPVCILCPCREVTSPGANSLTMDAIGGGGAREWVPGPTWAQGQEAVPPTGRGPRERGRLSRGREGCGRASSHSGRAQGTVQRGYNLLRARHDLKLGALKSQPCQCSTARNRVQFRGLASGLHMAASMHRTPSEEPRSGWWLLTVSLLTGLPGGFHRPVGRNLT